MQHSSPHNRQSTSWTLADLHRALADRLQPAPSLPALKNLSRAGAIPRGVTLADAAQSVIDQVRSGSIRVRGPRRSMRPDRTSTHAVDAEYLAQEIARRLKPLRPADQDASATGLPAQALRAIEQLEATRKHVLMQFDALRQHYAATHGRMQTAGAGGGLQGIDFLDWQRLQARLARMEEMVTRILQRLDDLAAQQAGGRRLDTST